jgi:hypothetical protein
MNATENDMRYDPKSLTFAGAEVGIMSAVYAATGLLEDLEHAG